MSHETCLESQFILERRYVVRIMSWTFAGEPRLGYELLRRYKETSRYVELTGDAIPKRAGWEATRILEEFKQRQHQPAAEKFTLANEPAKKKPAPYFNRPGLQKNLIDGLDCLPGQQDLFEGEIA